jgi:cob(I)alamin adenosyltransferase
LDELNIALYYRLFSVDEAVDMIENRKENVEVVVTGRFAPEEIINIADLVTEMKEIKHYYTKGIMAREGIEF